MKELWLPTPEATEAFGAILGARAPGGLVVAFEGDLGAGKTVMAKGIARGLGIDDEVTSPTFTIVSEYEGRLRLHHMDAYRLAGPEDFYEIGGEDLVKDEKGLCLVEWSERVRAALPPGAESISLKVEDGGRRRAILAGPIVEAAAEAYAAGVPA